jgi:hypothetical protein
VDVDSGVVLLTASSGNTLQLGKRELDVYGSGGGCLWWGRKMSWFYGVTDRVVVMDVWVERYPGFGG